MLSQNQNNLLSPINTTQGQSSTQFEGVVSLDAVFQVCHQTSKPTGRYFFIKLATSSAQQMTQTETVKRILNSIFIEDYPTSSLQVIISKSVDELFTPPLNQPHQQNRKA